MKGCELPSGTTSAVAPFVGIMWLLQHTVTNRSIKILEEHGKITGTLRDHTHSITADALFKLEGGLSSPHPLTSFFYLPTAIR